MGRSRELTSVFSRFEIYKELENLAIEMNYSVEGIIVEGLHDKKTLKFLGYKGPILTCSKMSLQDLAEYAAKHFTRVVILTDFDEAGETLAQNLSRLLVDKQAKIDNFYRRRYGKLLRMAKILTIENIFQLKLDLFSQR